MTETKHIGVRVTAREHRMAQIVAALRGQSVSEMLRGALRDIIDQAIVKETWLDQAQERVSKDLAGAGHE